MTSLEDVKVEVLSNGQILKQYDDPEPDHELGNRTYVEAVTGATFKIKVTIKPTYDISCLKPGDLVRARFAFDNDKRRWAVDAEKSYIEKCRASGQPAFNEIGCISKQDPTTREWFKGDLSFGALITTETNDASIKPEDVKGLGSIRTKVSRISKEMTGGYFNNKDQGQQMLDEVPEKALKGKAMSNVIKLSNMQKYTREKRAAYSGRPFGQGLSYAIHYQSRNNLQTLGVIPRSPTPEPQLREELRELRARLARLEEDKVKAEHTPTSTIKRERQQERDTNERSRKRSRLSSGDTAWVDLTAD